MKILVQPPIQPAQPYWCVRLNQHSLRFRNEAEARQFVATLQNRLNAPHALPHRLAG